VALALADPRALYARVRQRAFRSAPADRDPVVLRHSRIYILPSRRGLMLIATLTLMLLTSLNYALSLGLTITFLLAGLISAALLHTFRNLAGIEVKPLAAGDTFVGGELSFSVALIGGSAARASVTVAASGAAITADVPAGAAQTVSLSRRAEKRGRVPLGRITLSSDYPLGLWRGWAYVHFPLAGIAYPGPEPSAPPLPRGGHGTDIHAPGRSEDNEFAGLREYQRGDPLQRVAWKAVARGAGWYTKAFDGVGAGGPVHLAWSALPAHLDVEARLARLTAWVLAAERTARPFSLSLPGASLPVGQGREQRRAALTMLALYHERA